MEIKEPIDWILTRRSTRKFKPAPVDQAVLRRIIETGRYAPSGGNNQSSHIIVVQDGAVLEKLRLAVREAFAAMEIRPDTYKSYATAIRLSKRGTYVYDYHAPVLVLIANKKTYGNNMADSACVAENMCIAANMENLGSCYINEIHWLTEHPTFRPLLTELGLAEDEDVYATVILGLPATADGLPDRRPLPRHGNPVTWVGEEQ